MSRMDEMELQHNFYAIKAAYVFTLVFEFIYLIYIGVSNNIIAVTSNIVFLLLLSQSIIYFLTNLVLKNKVGDRSAKISMGAFVSLIILIIIIGLILVFR